MKNLNTQLAVVVGAVILASFSLAQAAGTSAAQFLKLGAGARAAGMGDAFCSVSDDANATYWNPAGLAQIEQAEVSMMHNSSLQDTAYQFLSGVIPMGNGVLGGFIQRLDAGTIDKYSASDVKSGSFDAGSTALGASMGRKVGENLLLGVTAKFVSESIEDESATSFAGDFGLLYKKDIATFGLSVQNVGPAMKMVSESSPLPLTVRAGASRRFCNQKLLGAIDAVKPNDNDLSVNTGVEYKVNDMLSLRGGYKFGGSSLDVSGITNINAGVGVTFNRFNFDYSVSPFGDLGIAHRVSLLFRFAN
jgi:hypothetical protein